MIQSDVQVFGCFNGLRIGVNGSCSKITYYVLDQLEKKNSAIETEKYLVIKTH